MFGFGFYLLLGFFLLEVLWIQILDDISKWGKKTCKKKLQPNWRHNHLIKAVGCKKTIYKREFISRDCCAFKVSRAIMRTAKNQAELNLANVAKEISDSFSKYS